MTLSVITQKTASQSPQTAKKYITCLLERQLTNQEVIARSWQQRTENILREKTACHLVMWCNNNNNNNLRLILVKTNRYSMQHITVCHTGQQWHDTHTVTQDSSNNLV